MDCSIPLPYVLSMKFYKRLYVGESIRDPESVKNGLLQNQLQFSVFVIAVSSSEDQLDIVDSKMLLQPFWDKENLLVVGLAGSRDEAIRLVISMTERVVRETGGADIKHYLLADAAECEEA